MQSDQESDRANDSFHWLISMTRFNDSFSMWSSEIGRHCDLNFKLFLNIALGAISISKFETWTWAGKSNRQGLTGWESLVRVFIKAIETSLLGLPGTASDNNRSIKLCLPFLLIQCSRNLCWSLKLSTLKNFHRKSSICKAWMFDSQMQVINCR